MITQNHFLNASKSLNKKQSYVKIFLYPFKIRGGEKDFTMSFKRNDLTISAIKYATIIGVEKSDFVKMMTHKKVPMTKKGEYDLNSAIAAVEPHIQREKILRQVFSFFTMKGGVGKTLNCANMGHYLALLGYKVLLVDLDPQCNLTTVCGVGFEDMDTSKDILSILTSNKTIGECIVPIIRNVDLVMGSEMVGQADVMLAGKPGSDNIIQSKIDKEGIRSKYDFIFFDNHSSTSKCSNNAYMVSDAVISVVNPDMFSYNGIQPVINSTEDVSTLLKRDIRNHILINNFEPSSNNQRDVAAKIVSDYGQYVLQNFVKRSTDFVRATMENKPFYCFSGNNSNAIKDYAGLLEEFIDISSKISTDSAADNMEVIHG